MVAPGVKSLIEMVCVPRYVPPGGLNVGVAVIPEDEDKVQFKTFWIAVRPPVPPVKPTKAVFPPTMLGMLIGLLVVNVFAAFVVSVIVIVKVVPSYVMCILKTFPLCRSTPELVMSTAGVVGETPFV
jgi:hypothetical protein